MDVRGIEGRKGGTVSFILVPSVLLVCTDIEFKKHLCSAIVEQAEGEGV